eukprot:3881606-Rhodomonas_salina.2
MASPAVSGTELGSGGTSYTRRYYQPPQPTTSGGLRRRRKQGGCNGTNLWYCTNGAVVRGWWYCCLVLMACFVGTRERARTESLYPQLKSLPAHEQCLVGACYLATRLLQNVQYSHSASYHLHHLVLTPVLLTVYVLRVPAYAPPTECPVLTERMVLPDLRARSAYHVRLCAAYRPTLAGTLAYALAMPSPLCAYASL